MKITGRINYFDKLNIALSIEEAAFFLTESFIPFKYN